MPFTSSLSPFSWEEKGSIGWLSTPLLPGEGSGVRSGEGPGVR